MPLRLVRKIQPRRSWLVESVSPLAAFIDALTISIGGRLTSGCRSLSADVGFVDGDAIDD